MTINTVPPPLPTPPQGRKHHVRRWGIIVTIALVVWAAAMTALPRLNTSTPMPLQPTAAAAPDDARLEKLESRLLSLETSVTRPDPESEKRVAQLEAQVGELQRRVKEQQTGIAAVVAFQQMKEAFERGEPYRAPLDRLQASIHGQADIQDLLAKLAAQADGGAPTPALLQQSFTAAIPSALTPNPNPWQDAVHSLIRVRKIGKEHPGNDDGSVVARAEFLLQEGKIAETLKTLAALSPAAKEAFSGWTEQAGAYLRAREAVDALQVKLLADKTS